MGIRIKRIRYRSGADKDLETFEIEDLQNGNIITKLNKVIDKLDFFNKNISLSKNFSGYEVEVTFAAGETKDIQHFLGIRPLYRIVLRQEGNGVISDVPSFWNDKTIRLINNGAVQVKATILILKE
jgi:hypothetical protein